MKIELDNPQKLSLERKIKMHEAREGIITRLARDLPANIEMERFLNVVVSEIGRMLEADRCDLLQQRFRRVAERSFRSIGSV